MAPVAVVIACLALPAAAGAAFPGANGKIAFTSYPDFDNEIATINPDGSGQVNLTANTVHDHSPDWSPDGQWISFVREPAPGPCCQYDSIWKMRADGSSQVRLTFLSGNASDPAWSPDGEKVAFARTDWPSTQGEIWAVNSDGTGEALLAAPPCPPAAEHGCHVRSLSWSPDGTKIAFANVPIVCDGLNGCTLSEGPPDVWTVTSDGATATPLIDDPSSGDRSLDWSPDGERMVLERDWEIAISNLDGGPIPTLTGSAAEDLTPAFSPDGQQIVWKSNVQGDHALYVMDDDGANKRRLGLGFHPDWQPLGALDPYPRPGGGSPIRVPLVPSYEKCTSPNSQHVEPLDEPSCTPPALASQVLTTGTAGRGQGSTRLDVVQGDPGTQQDEADVRISAHASDVRCKQTSAACPSGAGSDFTGTLLLSVSVRITDRASGFGGVSATVSDAKLQAPLDCTASSDATLGATCTTLTTADSLIPGYVTEQKRTVVSSLSTTLDDPGPNGTGYASPACPPTCGDGDEAPYLEQGVFIGL